MNKGQVSIFVLLAVIVLITLFFINYTNTSTNIDKELEESISSTGFSDSVKNYVDSCLREVSKNVVGLIGIQGGYYENPEHFVQDRYFFFSYYFYDNRNVMPSKEVVEKEISKAVNGELPYCIDNFSIFKEQGLEIEDGPINSFVSMTDKDIIIELVYPINFKKQSQSTIISNFNTKIPVRLGEIYDVAKRVIDQQVEDSQHICLSCVMDLGEENNLDFRFVSNGEDKTLFVIIDNESIIEKEPYNFMFVGKYEN